MKKFLFLAFIAGVIISTSAQAQPSQPAPANKPSQPAFDKEAMLKQMKEQQVPQMVEKTGLTEAQANRVVEINLEIRMQAATELKDLSGDERTTKLAELKALKEKKYSEIPLTDEQIKSVYAFYEGMGKTTPAPQRSGN